MSANQEQPTDTAGFGLRGKVALITGASRGIGAATARKLAELGAHVILAARSEAAIQTLAAELRDEGKEAEAIVADLSSGQSIEDLVEAIRVSVGRLDILVNNAGVLPEAKRLERHSRDEWNAILNLNVTAAWDLSCRAKHLMDAGGTIVNVTSTAGTYPSIGLGAYCVSKTALEMLTRACALEWARDGIRVLGIVPGKIDTDMVVPIVQYLEARGEELNPLRRVGQPDEVAELIAFLVSDRAAYITGALVAIDGGELIRAGA